VTTLMALIAAATWTDAIVLAAVALGASIGLTGIATFDPRVRNRLPMAVLSSGNVAVSIGLIIAGLAIVALAIGIGES
jgi:hypothetical protein